MGGGAYVVLALHAPSAGPSRGICQFKSCRSTTRDCFHRCTLGDLNLTGFVLTPPPPHTNNFSKTASPCLLLSKIVSAVTMFVHWFWLFPQIWAYTEVFPEGTERSLIEGPHGSSENEATQVGSGFPSKANSKRHAEKKRPSMTGTPGVNSP